MQANSKHLVVGDVIESDGTIIAINPDDPIWRRRFTVQRPDGTTREAWYSSIMTLYIVSGPTFTRCRDRNLQSTYDL